MKKIQTILLIMASAVSGIMYPQEYVMQDNHFVTIDGTRLHYRTGGSGPYLLLLHGFTLSSEQWEEYYDDFIHNFTIIAIDLPGHGKSDALHGQFSYDGWADLILKFMNDLGIKSAKAIGHSAGAITLLHMATRQPEALESLILINGAHRLSEEGRNLLLEDDLAKADLNFQQYYLKIHGNDMTRISGVFKDIRGFARDYPTKTAEATEDLGRFSGINIPIFLIWGDRDIYFPVDIATELFLALPDARLWIIPQQGHTPLWKFMGGNERASETFPMMALEFLGRTPIDNNAMN